MSELSLDAERLAGQIVARFKGLPLGATWEEATAALTGDIARELTRLAQERDELDRTDRAVMRKLDLRILDLEKSRDGWMAQAEREGALVHALKAELTDRTHDRDLFQQENHRLLSERIERRQ